MKSRFIRGVSKSPPRTIVVNTDDLGTTLKTPMSMQVEVDKNLPPNTVIVSGNWGLRDFAMSRVDEALGSFLRTMGRMYNIQEIASDKAFKPVVGRNSSGIPQLSKEETWKDKRSAAERAFNVIEAQTFASFLDMMSALRKRAGDENDQKQTLPALRFDTLVRSLFPQSYNELNNAPNITSVYSRVAKMLGSRMARADHQLPRDVIADRLVARAIDLISKGQWGKF